MKKLIVVLLLLILGFAGCETVEEEKDDSASVRFQNSMSDGTSILYGIRISDAEYEGELSSGSVTDSYKVKVGDYSLQMKNADGDWITTSSTLAVIPDAGDYTIVISGTYSLSSFRVVQDN